MCICDNWEAIHGFRSAGEFDRFVKWIDELIKEGSVEEIPVAVHAGGIELTVERWFRCPGCPKIWRLVEPDVPFLGTFAPVDSEDPRH